MKYLFKIKSTKEKFVLSGKDEGEIVGKLGKKIFGASMVWKSPDTYSVWQKLTGRPEYIGIAIRLEEGPKPP
jgi:hypothetical protein